MTDSDDRRPLPPRDAGPGRSAASRSREQAASPAERPPSYPSAGARRDLVHPAFAVREEGYARCTDDNARLRFLTGYAVMAPSVLNTQPWRFRMRGGELELIASRDRTLQRLDPDARQLTISCGAALFNLRVAAHHFGRGVRVDLLPDAADPDVLARAALGGAGTPDPTWERLFAAIPERRSNRGPLAPEPVTEETLAEVQAAAEAEGVRLLTYTDPAEKRMLGRLTASAYAEQIADEAVQQEVREWLRPMRAPDQDGVPDAAQGEWDRRSYLDPNPRSADIRGRVVSSAPAVLVLSSEADGPRDWMRTGQALQRVLLLSTARGLAASYLNAALEVGRYRREVSRLTGGNPQVLFRLGRPETPSVDAPRRPPVDVFYRP